MIEGFAELFLTAISEFTPFAVFLTVFSFLYASLGKSRVFHFQKRPRLVLSLVLALYSAQLVLTNSWNHIIAVTATAVSIGLIGLIMYHVGLQRGKTKEEATEVIIEDEENNPV